MNRTEIARELVAVAKILSAAKDEEFIADQLVNAWEHMSEREMVKHLASSTKYSEANLKKFVDKWYDDFEFRMEMDLARTSQWVRLLKSELKAASSRTAGVADTIAKQMGGLGKLRAMLGAHSFATSGNDFSFVFPNKQRSKGNSVKVTYNPGSDLYTMEFFNVSVKGVKRVAKYDDLMWDQLVEVFERQTGWYLTF